MIKMLPLSFGKLWWDIFNIFWHRPNNQSRKEKSADVLTMTIIISCSHIIRPYCSVCVPWLYDCVHILLFTFFFFKYRALVPTHFGLKQYVYLAPLITHIEWVLLFRFFKARICKKEKKNLVTHKWSNTCYLIWWPTEGPDHQVGFCC